jgi:subtilisin family serine protease
VILLAITALAALIAAPAGAGTARIASDRYIVVFAGDQRASSFDFQRTRQSAVAAVRATGGALLRDFSREIGVALVRSQSPTFASDLEATGLVRAVGSDFSWLGLRGAAPPTVSDPAEIRQWDMRMIGAYRAHRVEKGRRATDVGILDSGVDGSHPDFVVGGRGANVNCARSRNFVEFVADGGPGVGNPDPCVDNQFHGTHVAGTVAAQQNGVGVVGVAPNVELVSVKVCDASGYCYAGGVVNGITYAGRQKLDVINMSFYVDDDEFQQSTEFKCSSDPVQRAFRMAVYRAIAYARGRGVTPIAALGNSDQNLRNPDGVGRGCKVVPAETKGVIGVASLGAKSEKARYSNWGYGPTDVTAPGGNGTTGDCTTTILSTLPGAAYGCIQGTSMASPHAAGVAALIVSRYGTRGSGGDMRISPDRVERILEATTIDIGARGYDKCFGEGRINAARAVASSRAYVYRNVPACGEPN